jgi:hypothetical protein
MIFILSISNQLKKEKNIPAVCTIGMLSQSDYYLSPAPQAEPQAAGFSSGSLSPAPQAEPQAAGFSSGFLSPAPQAAAASTASFLPNRFLSPIILTS